MSADSFYIDCQSAKRQPVLFPDGLLLYYLRSILKDAIFTDIKNRGERVYEKDKIQIYHF